MDDINAVLLTTSTRTIYTNLAGDVSFVRQLLTSDSKIITIIIKSNQVFFCSRRCKIIQYKELMQSLEQGHKWLQRTTYLYPKIMFKKLKTHSTKIPFTIIVIISVYLSS